MAWHAQILSLFPAMFPGPLGFSLAGKALKEGIWTLESLDIRDFAYDKHRAVDDTPAGGGPGMVLRCDVLARGVDEALARQPAAPLVYLSPRGALFTQAMAERLAKGPGITLIAGRFEGIDERLLLARPIEEVSIGDYVLSGGEPAAMVVLDAIVRLLPGVVGEAATLEEESFARGLLEYPHYTRPQCWEGRTVPEVLTSGDHGKIKAWRLAQAEQKTRERRPDLWQRYLAGRPLPGTDKKG
ncbi:MAG: tRNA (guanosine(37)-N1)-methyltransferase TrmD [Pseudomonadota bacterium]|jgi:tRNA (guanine37-N1)-methyltransferase